MITEIAFTVYPVSRMARAREFYERVLGLKQSGQVGEEWVEYDLGSGTFAITTTPMGHTPGAKGAGVGFEVDDLDSFLERLKNMSVPFVVDLLETPVCRLAVIEDPDANHLTMHERKGPRAG